MFRSICRLLPAEGDCSAAPVQPDCWVRKWRLAELNSVARFARTQRDLTYSLHKIEELELTSRINPS